MSSMTKIMKAGSTKQGYCKLCSLEDPRLQDEFDKRVLDYTPKQLNAWLSDRVENFKPVNRQTVYSHREHVRNPKDKLVRAVQRRAMVHGVQKQRVDEQAFLDAVIAAGMTRAVDDPDEITTDQALKAAGLKIQSRQKSQVNQTLIAVLTGNIPQQSDVVEGEAHEV